MDGNVLQLYRFEQMDLDKKKAKNYATALRDKVGADNLPPIPISGPIEGVIYWLLRAQCFVCQYAGHKLTPQDFGAPAVSATGFEYLRSGRETDVAIGAEKGARLNPISLPGLWRQPRPPEQRIHRLHGAGYAFWPRQRHSVLVPRPAALAARYADAGHVMMAQSSEGLIRASRPYQVDDIYTLYSACERMERSPLRSLSECVRDGQRAACSRRVELYGRGGHCIVDVMAFGSIWRSCAIIRARETCPDECETRSTCSHSAARGRSVQRGAHGTRQPRAMPRAGAAGRSRWAAGRMKKS